MDDKLGGLEELELLKTELQCNMTRNLNLYLVITIFFIILISILPFISVPISISGLGIIRPLLENTSIRPPIDGKVASILVSINQSVKKGQPLIWLDSTILFNRIAFLKAEILEDQERLNDLKNLSSGERDIGKYNTDLCKQSLINYLNRENDVETNLFKTKIDYERALKLHKESVIADVEFEGVEFEFNKAKNNLVLLRESQILQWQDERTLLEKEIAEHKIQLETFIKEMGNLIVRAPINGTIQNLSSLQQGSYVYKGDAVLVISPDTTNVIEVNIEPSKIGLLKSEMSVSFQINSFNYNQWGLATGKVVEISNDIHIINNQPVFKVRCSLDQDFLQLKNGYKGYLKKGMTLQARFMVTERTLWQLLYDKMDDWLNPNTFSN
ncbi:MAG: HlyD family efflux transporter periplasmic adaptor subunit [Cyclobacteriaceae bacterium]|nr:HlyD family efflux transporter periplasmic adaptor subunit [Cyclobacteriaceae bacterium]